MSTQKDQDIGARMYEKFEGLLKEYGIRAYQVGKGANVSTSTLSEWKRGGYTPKLDKIAAIAKYFSVPIEYFLEDQEKVMGEDKLQITKSLFHTLKMTRAGENLLSCEYFADPSDDRHYEEFVLLRWKGGVSKKICVTGDSGVALITDVVRRVE